MKNPKEIKKLLMQDMKKKLHNYQKITNINQKNQKMSKKKDLRKNRMNDKSWKVKKKNYKKIIKKL